LALGVLGDERDLHAEVLAGSAQNLVQEVGRAVLGEVGKFGQRIPLLL